jgi:hypothetical protein
MTAIIEATAGFARKHGNLFHNYQNQIRRIIGEFSVVCSMGAEGGTVRDQSGKCWDWWPTEEVIPGVMWTKVKLVEAR